MEEVRKTFEKEWPDILKEGVAVHFRKGQDIFYCDHRPTGAYFVRSGKVRLSGGGNSCQDLCHWSFPKGDIYGVRNILKDEAFCCTATAQSDCEVVFIPRQALLSWADSLGKTER